jgi:hypothetical protein
MSNTFKATIAIVSLIIIAAAGIFILGKNRMAEVPSIGLQSSSVKSNIASSVAVIQTDVLPTQTSSKVEEASKVVEVRTKSQIINSISTQTSNCNLPESENLVKTEDGCFTFLKSGYNGIFKKSTYPDSTNQNLLYDTESNNILLVDIAKNYFSKIKSNYVSKNKTISTLTLSKSKNNEFTLSIAMIDLDFFKQNPSKQEGQNADRYNSIYTITQQSDKTWSYQFQGFIKDSSGKIINE